MKIESLNFLKHLWNFKNHSKIPILHFALYGSEYLHFRSIGNTAGEEWRNKPMWKSIGHIISWLQLKRQKKVISRCCLSLMQHIQCWGRAVTPITKFATTRLVIGLLLVCHWRTIIQLVMKFWSLLCFCEGNVCITDDSLVVEKWLYKVQLF